MRGEDTDFLQASLFMRLIFRCLGGLPVQLLGCELKIEERLLEAGHDDGVGGSDGGIKEAEGGFTGRSQYDVMLRTRPDMATSGVRKFLSD